MQARVERYGDDLVLILDREILEGLGIGEGTLLEIQVQDKTLILKPVRDEADEFERALDAVNKQYEHALKRLAQ